MGVAYGNGRTDVIATRVCGVVVVLGQVRPHQTIGFCLMRKAIHGNMTRPT